MRVRRDISAILFRSATDTWARIVDLVTGSDPGTQGSLMPQTASWVQSSPTSNRAGARSCSKVRARNCGSIAGSG